MGTHKHIVDDADDPTDERFKGETHNDFLLSMNLLIINLINKNSKCSSRSPRTQEDVFKSLVSTANTTKPKYIPFTVIKTANPHIRKAGTTKYLPFLLNKLFKLTNKIVS